MDDNTTMLFNMHNAAYNRRLAESLPDPETPAATPARTRVLPNSTTWDGRFRIEQNSANDYGIDRQLQRSGSFTGIEGIHTQDQAVCESMGTVMDRTTEHLGTSDVMVIRVRRRLIEAARALRERGEAPASVSDPSVYRVRSGGVILDDGDDWLSATEGLRRAYVQHPGLDLSLDVG